MSDSDSELKNWGLNRTLKTDAVKHPGRESITDAAVGRSSGHGRNVSFISCLLSKYRCECGKEERISCQAQGSGSGEEKSDKEEVTWGRARARDN